MFASLITMWMIIITLIIVILFVTLKGFGSTNLDFDFDFQNVVNVAKGATTVPMQTLRNFKEYVTGQALLSAPLDFIRTMHLVVCDVSLGYVRNLQNVITYKKPVTLVELFSSESTMVKNRGWQDKDILAGNGSEMKFVESFLTITCGKIFGVTSEQLDLKSRTFPTVYTLLVQNWRQNPENPESPETEPEPENPQNPTKFDDALSNLVQQVSDMTEKTWWEFDPELKNTVVGFKPSSYKWSYFGKTAIKFEHIIQQLPENIPIEQKDPNNDEDDPEDINQLCADMVAQIETTTSPTSPDAHTLFLGPRACNFIGNVFQKTQRPEQTPTREIIFSWFKTLQKRWFPTT